MPVRNRPPDFDQPRPPDDGAISPAGNSPTTTQPPDRDDLYAQAREAAIPKNAKRDDLEDEEGEPLETLLLKLVRDAESSAERYQSAVRKGWSRAYRAFENKHFSDSKYNSPDYAARSKIFRPKTRSAIRKAMASNAATLFSTTDAIAIQPGNEGDPNSRAGAALMQEVVNYRTDRTSGRNAIPWFKTCMGAVQDGTLAGIMVSKQNWKLTTKQVGEQPVMGPPDPATGQPVPMLETLEDGTEQPVMQPVMKTVFDRPDCTLIPPEQVIIHSGADWTDPAQSAAFLILKWPMTIDDIREKEKAPQNPWKHLEDSQLRTGTSERSTANSKPIRTAREGSTDRYDQSNTPNAFSTIWVNEVYVRTGGEDYTFFCIGHQHYLTEPMPVEEVYPWNDGERPVVIGYASLESHKIFPMAPAESWQQLQAEINDLANLTLDAVKMSIAPIAKVKRGAQVDLDKLRKRAPGTNILMQNVEDVVFDKPPGVDAGAWQQTERLNNDFDSLAGQFDQASVMGSRQLNETVGGMKLLSGAANALAEFDQRVIIETWTEPVLSQVVRLCQYYEHDATVLGLCGERAKLWEKHGVNQITDQLMEAQITCRVDIGLGAGDPQQRLQKFTMATQAVFPLLQGHKKFQSGEYELDVEAIMQEGYGAAGYRDGGKRFLKKNPPQQGPSPIEQIEVEKGKAVIERDRSTAALNMAKAQTTPMDAQLKVLELISDITGKHVDQQHDLTMQGHDHAAQHHAQMADHAQQSVTQATDHAQQTVSQATDHEHQRTSQQADHSLARDTAQAKAASDGGGKTKLAPSAAPPPQPAPQQPQGGGHEQQVQFIRDAHGKIAGAVIAGPNGQPRKVHFHRDAQGRIANLSVIDANGPPVPMRTPMLPPGQA